MPSEKGYDIGNTNPQWHPNEKANHEKSISTLCLIYLPFQQYRIKQQSVVAHLTMSINRKMQQITCIIDRDDF